MLDKKEMKLALFFGLAGIGTAWLLGFLSKWLSKVPGLTVNLQSISVETTGLSNTVGTGLGVYAKKLFTTVGIGAPEILYAFIGGAVFGLLGYYIVNALKLNLFSSKQGKLATIMVVGGLIAGAILSMSISIPTLAGAIIMAIDALVLSYILVFVDDTLKLGLIPAL